MSDHDTDATDDEPPADDWDPLVNYPVGPDDAGNVVIHTIGILRAGLRRLGSLFRRG